MAAMESTGSYWKPLYNIFKIDGLPVMVVNAQHMKAVPGSNIKDSERIAKLLSQGLLKSSFIPEREQRKLRELTRFRKSQIEERPRNLNRLQKMLEGANIKLSSAVSEIDGKCATELLELVIGKTDFMVKDVAEHRHGRMNSFAEALFLSLEGIITPMQRELFQHVMEETTKMFSCLENEELKYKVAMHIAVLTGMRRGEILGLEWRDIDFDKLKINLERTGVYTETNGVIEKDTKNHTSRTVSIPAELCRLLKEYKVKWEEQKNQLGILWQETDRLMIQWDGKPMFPATL